MRGMLHPFVESQTPPVLDSINDERLVRVCGLGLCVELHGPIISGFLLLFLLFFAAALIGRVRGLVIRLASFLVVTLFELIYCFLKGCYFCLQGEDLLLFGGLLCGFLCLHQINVVHLILSFV